MKKLSEVEHDMEQNCSVSFFASLLRFSPELSKTTDSIGCTMCRRHEQQQHATEYSPSHKALFPSRTRKNPLVLLVGGAEIQRPARMVKTLIPVTALSNNSLLSARRS